MIQIIDIDGEEFYINPSHIIYVRITPNPDSEEKSDETEKNEIYYQAIIKFKGDKYAYGLVLNISEQQWYSLVRKLTKAKDRK